MGCFTFPKFLLVPVSNLDKVTLNMKRLFTLIALLALTVGFVGCKPADQKAPEAGGTNAAPAAEATSTNAP
jgi:hypothetical protein